MNEQRRKQKDDLNGVTARGVMGCAWQNIQVPNPRGSECPVRSPAGDWQRLSPPSHHPFSSSWVVWVQRRWRREAALVSNHRVAKSDTRESLLPVSLFKPALGSVCLPSRETASSLRLSDRVRKLWRGRCDEKVSMFEASGIGMTTPESQLV